MYKNDPFRLMRHFAGTSLDWNTYAKREDHYLRRMHDRSEVDLNDGEDPSFSYFRVVKNKAEVYDIVSRSFYRRKYWRELPHGLSLRSTWNLLWTWTKPQIDLKKLIVFQRINHFINNKHISRKDMLKRSLERIKLKNNVAKKAFDIQPSTFVLPKEYNEFVTEFLTQKEKGNRQNLWILKPAARSRGRGIALISDYSGLSYKETMVIQKYIPNPLLLDGYKFDLRIYVLVTSINPLEVFLYKEGYARLSTEKYNLNPDDLENLFVHLTNYSIQKHNVREDREDIEANIGCQGNKISLSVLRDKLNNRGISYGMFPLLNKELIWKQISEIVIKALVAVQTDLDNIPNSFELFGYDIMIDSNLQCWLIEVNSSPSLHREHMIDALIKQSLIDDIIDLVDPPKFDILKLLTVINRRIEEEQGHKSRIHIDNNSIEVLNRDLTYILGGKHIRRVGEVPSKMGGFEMIAPSSMSEKIEAFAKKRKPAGDKI